jgi:hypothetical protein
MTDLVRCGGPCTRTVREETANEPTRAHAAGAVMRS